MAGVFRIGLGKIVAVTGTKPLTANTRVPELLFCRSISGKALKIVDTSVQKPAPYPYKEKKYGWINRFFDKTTSRFDENTKLIVVDGPIAAGKSDFAKTLAEDLDMLYMPEANLDMLYINEYGFDLRSLDSKVPESCRTFDVKDFYQDPKNRLSASFQIIMYTVRYSQYIDALAHILSTGQGVVLDRSVYSDFVFLESMFSQGYISRGARSAYYDVKKNTITELMRPHLVIYLDVPVNKIQENIKKRNICYEANSPVLTPAYLTVMENMYKQQFLKSISNHSELLVYDWSNGGDVEVVVEDIERIDFDRYTHHDIKLDDWRMDMEEDWALARHKYADNKNRLLCFLNVPRYDVPELVTDADDIKHARDIWDEAPGEKFEKGYNAEQGDTGLLFKMSRQHRQTLPLRERIIQA
ncbi:NADH dehydrogenase (ubiquinone) 42 kDa subunit [Carabus blaptoides fortunei]